MPAVAVVIPSFRPEPCESPPTPNIRRDGTGDNGGMGRAPRVELHDRGLASRMAITLLLLAAVYAALLVVLIDSGIASWIVVSIAAVVVAVQLSVGDRLTLKAIGAVEATPMHYAALHAAVERVCIQADMPKPRVAVAP